MGLMANKKEMRIFLKAQELLFDFMITWTGSYFLWHFSEYMFLKKKQKQKPEIMQYWTPTALWYVGDGGRGQSNIGLIELDF